MLFRSFKPFGSVSALTLGGGGMGQVWGETTREEAVATARLAAEQGITHFDMAPMYGRGEAETVIGEAFSRNHATILYANDQVSERAKDDRGLQQTLAILKDKVQKNSVNSVS